MESQVYDDVEVANVPFNEIRNVLQHAEANGHALCLVHPVWVGQSWWELLVRGTKLTIELGDVQEVLLPTDESDFEDAPRWRVAATVVDYR